MNKNVFGRKFKRDKNERKALFKGLMSSLVLNERIKTTEEKAKAIKGNIEKLITKAKNEGTSVQNLLQDYLYPEAIQKLINEVAPRFKERKGGYTRLIKLGRRFSDDASVVLIEWTEGVQVESGELKVENSENREVKEIKKANKIKLIKKAAKKESKKVSKSKKETKK